MSGFRGQSIVDCLCVMLQDLLLVDLHFGRLKWDYWRVAPGQGLMSWSHQGREGKT